MNKNQRNDTSLYNLDKYKTTQKRRNWYFYSLNILHITLEIWIMYVAHIYLDLFPLLHKTGNPTNTKQAQ